MSSVLCDFVFISLSVCLLRLRSRSQLLSLVGGGWLSAKCIKTKFLNYSSSVKLISLRPKGASLLLVFFFKIFFQT